VKKEMLLHNAYFKLKTKAICMVICLICSMLWSCNQNKPAQVEYIDLNEISTEAWKGVSNQATEILWKESKRDPSTLVAWKGKLDFPAFIYEGILFIEEDSFEIPNPRRASDDIHSNWTPKYLRKQLVARNPSNGKILWTSPDRLNKVPLPHDSKVMNNIYALAFANNQILSTTTDHKLVAFSLPDFKELYSHDLNQQEVVLLGCNQDMVFYIDPNHTLYALQLHSGDTQWNLSLASPVRSFHLIDSQRILISSYDTHKLWLINAQNGTIEWEYLSQDLIFHQSISFHQNKLYFLSEPNPGSNSNHVHAFDLSTLTFQWIKAIEVSNFFNFSHFPLHFYKDTLFLPSIRNGKLVQLNLKDGKLVKQGVLQNFISHWYRQESYSLNLERIIKIKDNLMVMSGTKTLMVYDLETQEVIWTFSSHELVYGPVLVQNKYMFVSDRSSYKDRPNVSQYFLIEIDTGNIIWTGTTNCVPPANEYFFFDSLYWESMVFPSWRDEAWDLAPIIQAWEARKP